MKHKSFIVAILFILVAGKASAQYDETNNLFYFAQRTPQSNLLNPAFFPEKNTFYLSLPGMGFQVGLPLSLGDIAQYDPNTNENVININNILDKLGNNNTFRFGMDANILGFGLKVANIFVDFNTQLRGNLSFGLPVNVINTVLNGNVAADGSAIPEATLLDGSLLNTQLYLESSVGVGVKIPTLPLTVGVHAKLLSGLMNMQMDNTRVTFETDEDFETIRARMYYEIMAASALPIDTTGGLGKVMDNMLSTISLNPLDAFSSLYYINSGNTGVAFDIGAKFKIGPLTVSASINDLTAGIHWQRNIVGLVPTNGEGTIEFDGMDVSNIIQSGNLNFDSLGTYVRGQLEGMTPHMIVGEGDYWFNIPTKMNLAATVRLLDMVQAGILFHGQFDRGLLCKSTVYQRENLVDNIQFDWSDDVKNTFRFNTTLSASVNVFNWLEVIAGSSIVYDGTPITFSNFLNPGLGIIFTPATLVQAYVMMDYASSMYLADLKAVNFKFGFNILIGRGNRD